MGGEVRIVLYASGDRTATTAARAAFAMIAALEDIMSDYRSGSEIRRLERRAGEWVTVSEPLFAVLSRSLALARATDGAFDPTVGPVSQLWRDARRLRRLPDSRALDSARALVGWRQVGVDSAAARIRLERPGMRLDLGAIAKGFIIHRALDRLRSAGVTCALVEAGGDIAVGDAPPGTSGWRVEIGDTTIHLANTAVSTSGARYQYVEIDGVRYSHVIDPRSGMPLTTALEATVIAADGATADALATAITILGPEQGRALAARFGAAAFVRSAAATSSARRPE
jgi:thiamine biosynthesis lipoprotein